MNSVKARVLDRIDMTILDTLQKDGRISNVELAKKVSLSASPCLDRVKKLESEGIAMKQNSPDPEISGRGCLVYSGAMKALILLRR